MSATDFFGNIVPVTSSQSVGLNSTAIVNGVITVGSQNTYVDAGSGAYTIQGGSGSNTYLINSTAQTLIQAPTTSVDTVEAFVNYVLPASVSNLVIGSGAYAGVGNASANYIVSTITTGAWIDGGGGNDVLTGGGGGDTYVFDAGNSGDTLITDFLPGANADLGKTDEVHLNGYSQFATFAEVQAAMTQVGTSVVLTLSPTTSIKFANTQVGSFTADNFELAFAQSNLGAQTFNGTFSTLSLWNGSTGTWATNYGWGGNADSTLARTLAGNGEQELYVDAGLTGTGTTALGLNPYTLNNGVLTIHAGATPTSDISALWGYKYTSGMISTRYTYTQTYGYFEAKMELPSGTGNWPAFWLYAVNGNSELDVMEEKDGSDMITGTAHNNGNGTAATGVKDYIPNITSGFHTFGVLWTATTITWYVDGISIGSVATPSNMHSAMYMIANLAVDSAAPSSYAGGNLQIAYIHAYSLANSPVQAPTTPSTTAPTADPGPTLSSVSASVAGGGTIVKIGGSASISVHLSESVTVAGTPTLTLSDGETATYVSGSGTSTLVFAYTAANGHTSSDLQVSSLNLPTGASVVDSSGAAVSGAFTGDLKISVATVAPTVTSLSAVNDGAGTMLADGEKATLTVHLNEAVTVTGAPTLQLNDGGTATYAGGSGTNTLTFTYIGGPSQHTDLSVKSLTLPSGATILDAAGNAMTTAAGSLGLWISSVQPASSTITETTSTGTSDVRAGSTVTFTMSVTEAVTVTGKPTLQLNDGDVATYVSGSGTNTLTFKYTVAGGDNVKGLHVTGLGLPTGAAITDSLGNPFSSATTVAFSSIVVDTTPPTITGVTAQSSGLTNLNTGQSATFTLKTSEAVDVTGAVKLTLSDGETATYVSGSGTNALTFDYTATAGHTTDNLQVTGLSLATGAALTDLAGNALSGSVTDTPHLAVNMPGVEIDYGNGNKDVFHPGSSSALIVEPASGAATAMVNSFVSFILPANVAILNLEGGGNLTGTGNALNDTITGNTGQDTLIAGTGNDTMTGGSGVDTFVFAPGAGKDVITNFGTGGKADVLNISAFLKEGYTAHLSDTSAGEIISFSTGTTTIELLGVHSAQLVATSVGYMHA